MRVLFLDIDGVLNSREWFASQPERVRGYSMFDDRADLDPKAVRTLKTLFKELPNTKMVVSSSWRIGRSLEDLKLLLPDFADYIIGRTPDSMQNIFASSRGDQIKMWLGDHPKVTHFAIVDDDISDMGSLVSNCVKTSQATGLLNHHVEALKELLQ